MSVSSPSLERIEIARNSLIYLLEIYQLLLEKDQTFHGLRSKVRIGFNSLTRLLDQLVEEEFIEVRVRDGNKYYLPTHKLFDLFENSFYDGLKQMKQL